MYSFDRLDPLDSAQVTKSQDKPTISTTPASAGPTNPTLSPTDLHSAGPTNSTFNPTNSRPT